MFENSKNSDTPAELSLAIDLISDYEAKTCALACFDELYNLHVLMNRLPERRPNFLGFMHEATDKALSKLQQFEHLQGVSAATMALAAYFKAGSLIA